MTPGSWRRVAPLKPSDFRPARRCIILRLEPTLASTGSAYVLAGDLHTLLLRIRRGERGARACVMHLARRPLIAVRLGGRILLSRTAHSPAASTDDGATAAAAALSGRPAARGDRLRPTTHRMPRCSPPSRRFAAEVDLRALAGVSRAIYRHATRPARGVFWSFRLSGWGDFVQSLSQWPRSGIQPCRRPFRPADDRPLCRPSRPSSACSRGADRSPAKPSAFQGMVDATAAIAPGPLRPCL